MDFIEKSSLKLAENFAKCSNPVEVSHLMQQYIQDIEQSDVNIDLPWPEDQAWINTGPLLQDDLLGKVVLLDFFTYCCINCIHIMPFLHQLEDQHSIADGFVIIGIHSAKFPNEKVSKNITSALQRYNISHPVINDFDLSFWNGLSVKCWPTLIVLSPKGKILLSLPGETHTNLVETLVSEAMKYYKDSLSSHEVTSPTKDSISKQDATSEDIKFPGKIAIDEEGKRLAIADTGNNRILICDRNTGEVLHVVGCESTGKQDGDFSSCSFNSPQGVAWHKSNSIFVADCDNHLIRKIDLMVGKVVTVAGTGIQGTDYEGGEFGTDQAISSPWDVIVAGSPRFSDNESILYIAMSGTHQIWAFFLQDADWQKGSEYKMGTCMRMAGSGQEENRNNSYPHKVSRFYLQPQRSQNLDRGHYVSLGLPAAMKVCEPSHEAARIDIGVSLNPPLVGLPDLPQMKAGFAQPSGLSVDRNTHKLFVADSESSTVRRINLANGAVEGLVGGHFDPTNLFAFGDEDGKARSARLQHPLAVAWDKKRARLYVADSYNHKIKVINPLSKVCLTLCGREECRVQDAESVGLSPVFPAVDLDEPGGICVDSNCECLYIADTNNHEIKVVSLETGKCNKLELQFPSFVVTDSAPVMKPKYKPLVSHVRALSLMHDIVTVGPHSTLQLAFHVESVHLTTDSPSSWQLSASFSSAPRTLVNSGEFRSHAAELKVSLAIKNVINLLGQNASSEEIPDSDVTINLVWEAMLYYCLPDSQLCLMKQLHVTVPVKINPSIRSAESLAAAVVISSLE